MIGLDERMAVVESRIEEQALRINDVREAVASLEARMNRGFERVDRRLDSLDAKVGRLTGVMVAMLIAIVGGLSGVIAAILQR